MNVKMSAILAKIVKMMIKEKSLSKKVFFVQRRHFEKCFNSELILETQPQPSLRLKTSMKSYYIF